MFFVGNLLFFAIWIGFVFPVIFALFAYAVATCIYRNIRYGSEDLWGNQSMPTIRDLFYILPEGAGAIMDYINHLI